MPGPSERTPKRVLRQAPPRLRVDTARVVLAGIGLWAVALVVLLLLGDQVDRTWTWTCVAGIVLALLGLGLMRWQRRDHPAPHASRARRGPLEGGR